MIPFIIGAFLLLVPPVQKPSLETHWGHEDTAPAYEIAGGKARVYMVKEGPVYTGILEGFHGLKVPPKNHAQSMEIIYVIEGSGVMTIAGKQQKVRPGMTIQVPAGVEHSFIIPKTDKGRFKAFQVYTPSGPEQRFKKGRRIK